MQSTLYKQEIGKFLTSLQHINPNEISKKDGTLDFDKLKENPEVITIVKKLKDRGVDRKYLLDNFFIAGMTIGHLLNNNTQKQEKNKK